MWKYLKNVLDNNWSKKGILIEVTKFWLKNIKINIVNICKINLFDGDFNIFRSDKSPTINIKKIM